MRLREHAGIIPGRIDILYCKPSEITIEEGYNVRDLTTAEARAELDELKAQVKEHGVITPLKIRFDGERIILVEGHRRRTVALELIAEFKASGGTEGRDIISVPIFPEAPGTTVEERDAGLLVSNTGSRLKPLELANLIYRMHMQRGMSLEAVAKSLGISMPVLKNHLAMRAMPEPVKQQVRDGDVSPTLAARLVKEQPEFAAELIRKNKEENERLGMGKGKRHKVTATTIKRDRPKAAPKSDPKPKEGEAHAFDDRAAQMASTPADSLPPVQEHRSETDAGGADRVGTGTTAVAAPSFSPLSDETPPPAPRPMAVVLDDIAKITTPRPRAANRIDELLLEFISLDVAHLVAMYSKLCGEREQAASDDQATAITQEQLCVAADVIGALRFPDDWEGAKANSELAQVA